MFKPAARKADFPILSREVNGHPLTYLDSAATSQKPVAVLQAMDEFYTQHNANAHRGIHTLSEEATAAYEDARAEVAKFVGARAKEIVFTKNATEAINLVAYSWARQALADGGAILLTEMEHHANLVPWYQLAKETGSEIRFVRMTATGELDLADFAEKLPGTKLVGVTHLSNVLGTINPLSDIANQAHAAGAFVLVDGAQAVPHLPVNVTKTGADFYVFSAHKMLGPTGIGALWAREELLDAMPPFLGGGEMIGTVGWNEFTPAEAPHKFEAGTMPVAEAVGFAAAVRYLKKIGMAKVRKHEQALTEHALKTLPMITGLTWYGPGDPARRGGVISFTVAGIHAHDLATLVDEDGVAIRSGHHCAEPLHEKLGVPGTARASWSVYTTPVDIDRLAAAIERAKHVFGSGSGGGKAAA